MLGQIYRPWEMNRSAEEMCWYPATDACWQGKHLPSNMKTSRVYLGQNPGISIHYTEKIPYRPPLLSFPQSSGESTERSFIKILPAPISVSLNPTNESWVCRVICFLLRRVQASAAFCALEDSAKSRLSSAHARLERALTNAHLWWWLVNPQIPHLPS